MNLLFAIFFGAGLAAFVYNRFGRRVGYGNTQNIWIVIGLTFVVSTIVFFTLFSFLPEN